MWQRFGRFRIKVCADRTGDEVKLEKEDKYGKREYLNVSGRRKVQDYQENNKWNIIWQDVPKESNHVNSQFCQ